MNMTLNNRYDFVYLFDVKDGNPNGDPDAGNLPRTDAETGRGLVTDVCLKRKVRNYVMLTKPEEARFKIFVRERAILNEQIQSAYEKSDDVKKALADWAKWQEWKKSKKDDKKQEKKKDEEKVERPNRAYEDVARDWMCENFFDIRTFGAVMTTGDKQDGEEESSKIKMTAGQVRGPVQLTFSRSVDPVMPQEHALTVCAARKADKPIESQIGIQGRKFTIPYGLYRAHGFISAHLANQTGFSENDLELLWQALENMFEHDRSAARGEMTARGLYVFKHESQLGNAHANELFSRVTPTLKNGATVPRDFSDYEVKVNDAGLPAGVKLIRRLG